MPLLGALLYSFAPKCLKNNSFESFAPASAEQLTRLFPLDR